MAACNAPRDQVRLLAARATVDAVLLRDIQRQAASATGCCGWRPHETANLGLGLGLRIGLRLGVLAGVEDMRVVLAEDPRRHVAGVAPGRIDRLPQLVGQLAGEPRLSPGPRRTRPARVPRASRVPERGEWAGGRDGPGQAGERTRRGVDPAIARA